MLSAVAEQKSTEHESTVTHSVFCFYQKSFEKDAKAFSNFEIVASIVDGALNLLAPYIKGT